MQTYLKAALSLVILCLLHYTSLSQTVTVSGTVYDITKKTPVEAVSVISTGGKGTMTDSLGHYSITVREKDSIYFSYLNKATPKYPVLSIANLSGFDISILRKVGELPNVFVKQRNYKLDSLRNREEYARIFNYSKPGFKTSLAPTPGGIGAGVDLDELINIFRFNKNKRMLAFKNRLLEEEQDKYIDHRYNKGLVKKLTGLTSPQIEDFMKEYRPTYNMTVQMNELEFGQFIIETYKYYMANKARN